jgi:hypothetical protein
VSDEPGGTAEGPEPEPEPAAEPGPEPVPDPKAEIARLHREAMQAGRSTYRDPATGYQVFTAAFLYERGWCCGSLCRHCPY